MEEEGFQVFFLRLFGADISSFLGVLTSMCDLERQKGGTVFLELTGSVWKDRSFQKSLTLDTILKS